MQGKNRNERGRRDGVYTGSLRTQKLGEGLDMPHTHTRPNYAKGSKKPRSKNQEHKNHEKKGEGHEYRVGGVDG